MSQVDHVAELGRELAALTDAQLAAYLAGCSAEELDVVEAAMAAAEAEAGLSAEAAERARERESVTARYARWWPDPAAFAVDAFTWPEGAQLHGYQSRALQTLARQQRLVLRKLRGAGGSAIAAHAVLHFALTRDFYGVDWKIVTTATVQRQLDEYLWPEIHKWAKRLRWEQLGRTPWVLHRELLDQGIKLAHGEAFAASPGDAGTIEGAHATQVLVVFDEAKGIRTAVFDAIEGGSTRYGPETGAALYALAVSSAGRPEGRFYDLSRGAVGKSRWGRQHITLAEAVEAGQVSPTSIAELAALWGMGSTLYRNHCLGEFADDAANTVIPLAWVEAANERWLALSATHRARSVEDVGIDVAREGADRTVLIGLAGDLAGVPVELPRGDGPTTAEACLSYVGLGPHGPLVLVDAIGVGSSVYDALRQYTNLGPRVMPFIASERSDWTDASRVLKFRNLRSAAWYNLRQLLDPALGATLALPRHDKLIGDLTSPRFVPGSIDSPQGILVEPKSEIAKRLGRSTNDGDALVMAAWVRVLRARSNLRPSKGKPRPGASTASIMGDILTEPL